MNPKDFTDLICEGKFPDASPLFTGPVRGVGQHYISQSCLDSPPLSPDTLVFLPEAIAQVGRSTDPDWADWERTTLYYPLPIPKPTLTVEGLMKAHRPPPPPPPVSLASNAPRNPQKEKQDHEEALRIFNEALPKWREEALTRIREEQEYCADWAKGVGSNQRGLDALVRAFDTLSRAVLGGKIELQFRPIAGGELLKLKPSVLTNQGVAESLIRQGTFHSGQTSHYVFADRNQLSAAFPYLSSETHVGGVDLESLSPYLRLAISVAVESRISDKNPSTVEALAAEIRQRAGEFGLAVGSDGDLSETFSLDIAKALRWPSARKGRAKGGTRKG